VPVVSCRAVFSVLLVVAAAAAPGDDVVQWIARIRRTLSSHALRRRSQVNKSPQSSDKRPHRRRKHTYLNCESFPNPIISRLIKIQTGFTFLVPAYRRLSWRLRVLSVDQCSACSSWAEYRGSLTGRLLSKLSQRCPSVGLRFVCFLLGRVQ